MPYERALQIEQRFERAVSLIGEKPLNARQLAAALQVSIPTVQRILAALKQRGYLIRSVRDENGWRYELVSKPSSGDQGGPR